MKLITVVLIFFGVVSFSQEKFTKPLNIPMYISGSFAELRSNHFHSGIDIKTNETVGHPVFAIQDGWVSRIKVSPWGFGYAVYIDHHSGYTSVYAHLDGFSDKLSEIVLKEQYKKKSFSLDKYFKKNEIIVKASEIIAYSGNSGGSSGPHLHFEIRDRATQKPINPLQFDFGIKDSIPPKFKELVIYQADTKAFIKPIFNKGNYYISDTILVKSEFNLGLVTNDISNLSNNPLGINEISLFKDDKLIYKYLNSKFSFAETRYLNSYIDYEQYKLTKKRIQKLFVDPGNLLSTYPKKLRQIKMLDGNTSQFRIEITDSKNNKSVLYFFVKYDSISKTKQTVKKGSHFKEFVFDKDNSFINNEVSVIAPKGALYKNFIFEYKSSDDNNVIGKKIYSIHKNTTALHKSVYLKIIIPNDISEETKRKLLIVNKKGKSFSALKTKIEGKYLTTKTKRLGDYAITIDTIAPEVKLEVFNLELERKNIIFKVSDNLSGISTYNAYVDKQWILLKYDYKTNKLYYDVDKILVKENKVRCLTLELIDTVGNKTKFEKKFEY